MVSIRALRFRKIKPSVFSGNTCLWVINSKVKETGRRRFTKNGAFWRKVEDSKYVFEAKTIQGLLLVLSTLQWRMNPITPLAFINHIVRRFGLLSNLNHGFLMRCESTILSIIADTATLSYVIKKIQPCDDKDYQN